VKRQVTRLHAVLARYKMATLNPCSISFAEREFRNPPAHVRRVGAENHVTASG
jgi:hypothetical protein